MSLPEGAKKGSEQGGQEESLPEGWRTEPHSCEEKKEVLWNKWKGTNYSIVMKKIELMDGWPDNNTSLKEALLSCMIENREEILVEEGEDILDGMETLIGDDGSPVH